MSDKASFDYASLPLGRKAANSNLIVPKLVDFRKRAAIPPPPVVDFASMVDWRMFLNDTYGCCTISSIAAGILQRSSVSLGTPIIMPDDSVKEVYFSLTGGPDGGLIITDALSWFSTHGISLRDQSLEIGTWGKLDNTDFIELRSAIHEFGSITVGWNLPESAQVPGTWDDVGDAPGTWGGHCTIVAGYDIYRGLWDVITWGERKWATDAFVRKYMDEAFAVLSIGEWSGTQGMSPTGVDVAGLQSALAAMAA